MTHPRAAAWPGLIFAAVLALSILGRPLAETLRGAGWLALSLWGVLGLALLFAARQRAVPLDLFPVAAAAVFASSAWTLPEERLHLGSFFAFGASFARAGLGARVRWAAILLAGPCDEGLQALLPGRRFDPIDVTADVVAALSGWWATQARPWPFVAALPLLVLQPLVRSVQPVPRVFPAEASPPAPPAVGYEPADLVLITVDALRRDAVPPFGSGGPPLPAFERLQMESLVAEAGRAASLWTSPSIVTLLTGLHPAVHGVGARGLEVQPALSLPLESLAAAGATVIGFAGDDSENYRHLGITRTLDRTIPADEALRAVLPELRSPFFLWLHLRDIHAPYDAGLEELARLGLGGAVPSGTQGSAVLDEARRAPVIPRARFPGRHGWLQEPLRRLYLAEVVRADRTLTSVLEQLAASPRWDRTIVSLTTDHGEELLDRDGVGHASTNLAARPQPELVEIPLWIRLPRGLGGGRTIPGLFPHVDLLPTLLSLAGWTVPAPGIGWDGFDRSGELRALAKGQAPSEAPPRTVLLSSSPCGWQCPQDRREERVHLVETPAGSWMWDGAGEPPAAMKAALDEADRRRHLTRSPVRSPP